MIKSFADKTAEDLFDGLNTKAARRLPVDLHQRATDRLRIMHFANDINVLRVPPSNRLEKLKGDRKEEWSIRINDQWRICFRYDDEGKIFWDVKIEDYH